MNPGEVSPEQRLASRIQLSLRCLSRGCQKRMPFYFRLRGGKPVAISTVSQWTKDGFRFPAVALLALCALDPELDHDLPGFLAAYMARPNAVLAHMSADAVAEYERAALAVAVEIERRPGGLWADQ